MARGRAFVGLVAAAASLWLALGAVPLRAEPAVPSEAAAANMVRVTLITLNNAVQTGNFNVLRARTGRKFRRAFSAVKLRRQFRDFRRKKVDLTPVVGLAPVWAAAPRIDARGRLKLQGHFRTVPQIVRFDLGYVREKGAWRLTHIAVDTTKAAQD